MKRMTRDEWANMPQQDRDAFLRRIVTPPEAAAIAAPVEVPSKLALDNADEDVRNYVTDAALRIENARLELALAAAFAETLPEDLTYAPTIKARITNALNELGGPFTKE